MLFVIDAWLCVGVCWLLIVGCCCRARLFLLFFLCAWCVVFIGCCSMFVVCCRLMLFVALMCYCVFAFVGYSCLFGVCRWSLHEVRVSLIGGCCLLLL